MSGDIGPGDVVVCVDAGACRCQGCGGSPMPGLKKGRSYRVLAVDGSDGRLQYMPAQIVGIHIDGWASASRFRKLNDGEDDADLIARIRQCKPVRTPEPVSHAGFHSRPAEGERSHPLALTPLDGERA